MSLIKRFFGIPVLYSCFLLVFVCFREYDYKPYNGKDIISGYYSFQTTKLGRVYKQHGWPTINKDRVQTGSSNTRMDKKVKGIHMEPMDTVETAEKDNLVHIATARDSQKSRIGKIHSYCKSLPNMTTININQRGTFYLNGPLFYCDVPKLGSTFLKEFLSKGLQCEGKVKRSTHSHDLTEPLFSYLNVGDPYSRLFSAYKNKLYKPDVQFWNKIGKDVVKTVRSNNSATEYGFDVTFRELVQYVIKQHQNGQVLNPHLEPIHKTCNPCKTHFDFVSKKETMSSDLVGLFDVLKNKGIVKDKVSISKLEQTISYHGTRSTGSIDKLFEAVRRYPNVSAYKLFLRHWATYQISGYILNKYELPFAESTIHTISLNQYMEALIKAIDNSAEEKQQLRLQREEALVQAYRSVPLELTTRLREFVKTDCLLFSYDERPALLFDRNTFNDSITHVYMKGI